MDRGRGGGGEEGAGWDCGGWDRGGHSGGYSGGLWEEVARYLSTKILRDMVEREWI